jgi:hypothetical protein
MTGFITITAPAYWASYLVNGDDSGITPEEKARADAWLARQGVDVVDVERGADGEAVESRFTWSYRIHDPLADCSGGDVLNYVCRLQGVGQ